MCQKPDEQPAELLDLAQGPVNLFDFLLEEPADMGAGRLLARLDREDVLDLRESQSEAARSPDELNSLQVF